MQVYKNPTGCQRKGKLLLAADLIIKECQSEREHSVNQQRVIYILGIPENFLGASSS